MVSYLRHLCKLGQIEPNATPFMKNSVLKAFIRKLPRPLFQVIRLAYGATSALSEYVVWLYRLAKYRLSRKTNATPKIGIHTVLIAKENILFLKEWIHYHKLKGVEYFFLYDNSGVTQKSQDEERIRDLLPSKVNKYSIPYDDIVTLSPTDISKILDEISDEIPNIFVHRWQPRDDNGNIIYGQVEAQNDALARFGHTVDWMVFMDMDEYLVSAETIPQIAQRLEQRGFDGGRFTDKVMATRFAHIDRFVTDIDLALLEEYPVALKFICKVDRTSRVKVHRFHSLGRKYNFPVHELFFLPLQDSGKFNPTQQV